ncbi:hypothetical protein ABZ297_42010, partial [Nonomuraea sp. NPDC005983]|uniref:hypothetical protein n=1 Tax=Nonomuraea sp. NPDC005983 TaxID=3155595 RepID=UPI0033A40797
AGGGVAGGGRVKGVLLGAGAAVVAVAVAVGVLASRTGGRSVEQKPSGAVTQTSRTPAQASTARAHMGLRAEADIPKQYRKLIVQAGTWCELEGLSPALVAGVVKMASDFDPDLIDRANDEFGIARWTPRVLQFWQPNGSNDPAPKPPFSPELSFPAMGRFFCTLGPKVADVPADPAAKLAALFVSGVDPVRREQGVPPRWKAHVAQVLQYRDQYQD